MVRQQLIQQIFEKRSFLCVGLDPELKRIPSFLLDFPDPLFEFNRRIIDATLEHCVAYKPNIAFYEALGPKGWETLQKTLDYIPDTHFCIADAKRGDIGNSSRMYAKTFFETLNFDAVTVAPYMGSDSVLPFFEYADKWVILLALTSNEGSRDFQFRRSSDIPLYLEVIRKAQDWGNPDNLMYVIGATQDKHIAEIRKEADSFFLLVPGVGKQGGSLKAVFENGANSEVGLLVNSSRSIIYAGQGPDFDKQSREVASMMHDEMGELINRSQYEH